MLNFKNVNITIFLFLILFVILKLKYDLSFYWLFLLGLVWISLTTIGSLHFKWNYFIKANHQNESIDKNAIAITFDDGPNAMYTPVVLNLLSAYDAKATFFCIGKNIEANPELLKRIIEEGHIIGNHSFSHDNLNGFFTTSRLIDDMEKTSFLVDKIVNLKMKLFRPPFGVTNPNIAKAVKKLNLHAIGWNIRSYDTIAKDAEKVYKRIIKNLKKGDIILMHDTNELSTIVLEKLLVDLKNRNLNAITLDKLLNMDAYGV
jgi:peptidoglycan/xylan/chitin deacetylase (PgdA/CDA1 family)